MPLKRVPYPCDPSASDPAGRRKKRGLSKPAAATAELRVKHRHGQQRRQTMDGTAEDLRGIFRGCNVH